MKKFEMIYGDPEAKLGKVLYAGKFRGMNYFVLNKGGEHPCGYVEVTGWIFDECKEFNRLKKQGRRNYWRSRRRPKKQEAYCRFSPVVHGGLTYSAGELYGIYDPELMEDRNRWFIGWDYAHLGDRIWNENNKFVRRGKSYGTDDVIMDCKRCIKAITEWMK